MPLRYLRLALVAMALFLLGADALATHNRAGEIVVEQIGDGSELTVRATIYTYTAFQGSSGDADRDSLRIVWGDGTSQMVVRNNGPLGSSGVPSGLPLATNLKLNTYTATHTYSGRGRYVIGMQDPNRVEAIRNINNGSSVQTPFYIQTVFTFLDPNFQGPNSTPRLVQPPIDQGCVGQPFIHNPNAFDPDGDSLAYRFGVPLAAEGVPVGNYRLPNEIGSAGSPSSFTLDPVTGTLYWDSPREKGQYNVVILVIGYRNGVAIDTTTRDMQINIETCANEPPVIDVATDFCLVAGQDITLDPVATAPLAEATQQVRLDAFSSTLGLDFQPATWTGDTLYHDQPWSSRYTWQTACEHVERFPYRVIFRAEDNAGGTFSQANGNLSFLKVVDIKVSAPPPTGLVVRSESDLVELDWDGTYPCLELKGDRFYGFSVWRREGANPFPFDSCRQGLAGEGYTRIANNIGVDALVDGRFAYTDDEVERGRTYCYRIVANFVRYTASGRPFNLVESIPGDEVCVQSSRALPLLTRVDVLETSATAGRIDVRWTAPLPADLDTVQNPPPYTYELLRSEGVGTAAFSPVPGTRQTYPSFAALLADTMYVDEGLNTQAGGFTYALRFESGGSDLGIPPLASSSVYLRLSGGDRFIDLDWRTQTSWENIRYDVLRQRDDGGFDTIATTQAPSYRDEGLDNDREYCYRIVAYGTYGVSTIYTPLVNRSQQVCAAPQDRVPPCVPEARVSTICDQLTVEGVEPPFPTTVSFAFTGDCEAAPDLLEVRVYELSDSSGTSRTLLGTIDPRRDSTLVFFDDFDIAGCFALTAVDTNGNESALSNLVCVENCPFYELPNVITPNGDGANDRLVPRVRRFVERVDFQLFDRWGVKVYTSTDADLGWDGTTLSGKPVTDGTYFYTCDVFERLADGTVRRVAGDPLSGYVEVLRGQ